MPRLAARQGAQRAGCTAKGKERFEILALSLGSAVVMTKIDASIERWNYTTEEVADIVVVPTAKSVEPRHRRFENHSLARLPAMRDLLQGSTRRCGDLRAKVRYTSRATDVGWLRRLQGGRHRKQRQITRVEPPRLRLPTLPDAHLKRRTQRSWARPDAARAFLTAFANRCRARPPFGFAWYKARRPSSCFPELKCRRPTTTPFKTCLRVTWGV